MSDATLLDARVERSHSQHARHARPVDAGRPQHQSSGLGSADLRRRCDRPEHHSGSQHAPGNGASAAKVLSHYSGDWAILDRPPRHDLRRERHRPGRLPGRESPRQLLAGSRPGWAITGLVGALGIFTVFALVVAAEQACSPLAAHMTSPDLGAIQAPLGTTHTTASSPSSISRSPSPLLGLSRASIAAGMTPKPFTWLAALIGAFMLVVGTIAGPAIAAESSTMALFGVAGLGFLTWLAFLITTGARLIRATEPA